jgi:hypothetical protein
LGITLFVKDERDGLRALLAQPRHRLFGTVNAGVLQRDRNGLLNVVAPNAGAHIVKVSCELSEALGFSRGVPTRRRTGRRCS